MHMLHLALQQAFEIQKNQMPPWEASGLGEQYRPHADRFQVVVRAAQKNPTDYVFAQCTAFS